MSAEQKGSPDSQERLTALGRVMGELVHDLNNEVMVLQGWAMLARGEMEAGRLPATEMERVVGITGNLAHMLRDMMDAVAGRGISPEVTFDPHTLTEDTIADRIRGLASVTVRFHCTLPDGVRVAGRPSFWIRIVSNLLGNASRHARAQVDLSLAPGRTARGGHGIVLRVDDDGVGVAPPEHAAVFDPFWRGEEGGVGLGLSSVVWAAEQLNGSVGYRDDSPLGGASFEVRVPIASRLGPTRPKEPPGELEALRGTRVLVVDDDHAVRHAVRRLLQRSGVDVRELDPTGEPEADILQSVLRTLPDVVLLDLRLGGRGGLALWRRMHQEMPQLARHVIFVTGAAPGEADWDEARLSGQPLLGKPFDVRELARAIRRVREEG